jgi:hypothetical protein
LVEQRIENPRVGGSIPPLATKILQEINGLGAQAPDPFFFAPSAHPSFHQDTPIQSFHPGTPFHLNESAGLAQFGLAHTKVVAYLSESVCRSRFKPAHQNASFYELLVTNAEHISAAVLRRFTSGAESIFVLRPTDF